MDDLVSRQAAIDATWEEPSYTDPLNVLTEVRDRIKSLPSVQPEPNKGTWLPDNNCVYEMRFVCSKCKASEVVPTIGFREYKPIWDFCPNCGADMRGEEE